MGAALFLTALVAGAAVLALWVDVRFPRLAPRGLRGRMLVAFAAFALLPAVPVAPTVAIVLGLFLPVLAFAFLAAIWLLRVLANPHAHI